MNIRGTQMNNIIIKLLLLSFVLIAGCGKDSSPPVEEYVAAKSASYFPTKVDGQDTKLLWTYRLNKGESFTNGGVTFQFGDELVTIDKDGSNRTVIDSADLSGDISGVFKSTISESLTRAGGATSITLSTVDTRFILPNSADEIAKLVTSYNAYKKVILDRDDLDKFDGVIDSQDVVEFIKTTTSNGIIDTQANYTNSWHVVKFHGDLNGYSNVVEVAHIVDDGIERGVVETIFLAKGIGMIHGRFLFAPLGALMDIELVSTNLVQ